MTATRSLCLGWSGTSPSSCSCEETKPSFFFRSREPRGGTWQMQNPRLLSLAVTAPRCSLASPRATFTRSLGFLTSSPAKGSHVLPSLWLTDPAQLDLRSMPCVNNQRQQTLSPLHLQRQFYVSTNLGQTDNGPTVKGKYFCVS
ncbi:hypothetical protein QOT17_014042 [Balamuthia mandrillaris]